MKRALLTIFMAITAFGAFANGTQEINNEEVNFSVEVQEFQPVKDIEIKASSDILAVIEIEHDFEDEKSPLIPKGTDGLANYQKS